MVGRRGAPRRAARRAAPCTFGTACQHCLAPTHMLMARDDRKDERDPKCNIRLMSMRLSQRQKAGQPAKATSPLLRGLCPSPNLLVPGVTAQMRSRMWQLQFWLARRGQVRLDAVSVPCRVSVVYKLRHIPPYCFSIALVSHYVLQYCVLNVNILLVLLK